MAKRRLAELQESKLTLSEQVKRLREQLENVESNSTSSARHQVDLAREIEQLKRQLQVSQQSQIWSNHSNEIDLSIERYKKEIHNLNEANQVAKYACFQNARFMVLSPVIIDQLIINC